MGIVLEIKKGVDAGKVVALRSGEGVTVGRAAAKAQLALPQDTFLSGLHFAVECGAQGCRVIDRKSSNGTFLNGAKIQEAMLANEDEIKAGQTVFVVKIVSDERLAAMNLPSLGEVGKPRGGSPQAPVVPPAASQPRAHDAAASRPVSDRGAGEVSPRGVDVAQKPSLRFPAHRPDQGQYPSERGSQSVSDRDAGEDFPSGGAGQKRGYDAQPSAQEAEAAGHRAEQPSAPAVKLPPPKPAASSSARDADMQVQQDSFDASAFGAPGDAKRPTVLPKVDVSSAQREGKLGSAQGTPASSESEAPPSGRAPEARRENVEVRLGEMIPIPGQPQDAKRPGRGDAGAEVNASAEVAGRNAPAIEEPPRFRHVPRPPSTPLPVKRPGSTPPQPGIDPAPADRNAGRGVPAPEGGGSPAARIPGDDFGGRALDRRSPSGKGIAFRVMGWSFPAAPVEWQVQEGFGLQQMGQIEFPGSVAATEEPLGGITLQQFVESQISTLRRYLRDARIEPAMPPRVSGADESMAVDVRHSTKDGRELVYRRIYARSGSSVGVLTVTTIAQELTQVLASLQAVLDGAVFHSEK